MSKDEYFEKKKEYLEKSMDAINKTLENLKSSEVMDIKLDIALSLLFQCLMATDRPNMIVNVICQSLAEVFQKVKNKPHLRIVQ